MTAYARIAFPFALFVALALSVVGCTATPPAPPPDATQRTAQALTLRLQPGPEGKDATVFSLPGSEDTPRGDGATLSAMAWTFKGVPGTLRSLIDFDLSSLPPGATIVHATLTLTADTTDQGHQQLSGTNELLVRRITAPWDEATVTWNTQPPTSVADQIELPPSTSVDQTYVIDVTPFIVDEVAHPNQTFGMMLQLKTEQFFRSLQFASSDHPDPTHHPVLTVDYTLGPAVGQIAGRVTYANSSFIGLPGVQVTVDGGFSTTTDVFGRYHFDNLPLGTYTARASRAGYTFGSTAFQNDHDTGTLSQNGQRLTINMAGWDRDPIVFVHGWTSDLQSDFGGLPDVFASQGYYTAASGNLVTSPTFTPPLAFNAVIMKGWINDAKYVTGRSKVILYAHSMGGLVVRSYVETSDYQGDVSQIFTYGTPHDGVPVLESLACLANQPAVCQMSKPAMLIYNLTHFNRPGVDYHLVGGNAPLWTTKTLFCFFGACVRIPWPDSTYHKTLGWFTSAFILGADDGLIQTYSALGGEIGNIDRFMTKEMHTLSLGHRDYHVWESPPSFSQEGFAKCSQRILIDHTTNTCGVRSFFGPSLFAPRVSAPVAGGDVAPFGSSGVSDGVTSNPSLSQMSRVLEGRIHAGERLTQQVSLEGGPTMFGARWDSGTVAFTLVSPSGLTIDPAYAASILTDPSDPGARQVATPPAGAVFSLQDAVSGSYYLPAAEAGQWHVVLTGGSDLPSDGVAYSAASSFDSAIDVTTALDRTAYAAGSTARLALRVDGAIRSAGGHVTVNRPDGGTDVLPIVQLAPGEFGASYKVPNLPGYARVVWALTGATVGGAPFERGAAEQFMIQSNALRLGAGASERAVPRAAFPGLNEALAVSIPVESTYDGNVGVSADLVAGDGATVVAHAVRSVDGHVGHNDIELRFAGEDIYASGIDGPYTVRNAMLLDDRTGLLAQQIATVTTTAAYRSRSFAPAPGAPTVTLDGPYRVEAGTSLSLVAHAVDPEGDALSYAWDLDDDGVFEASGQAVTLSTSTSGPFGLRTVRVQVTDGNTAPVAAETTVDVFLPAIVNLARDADVAAKSSQPGHPVSFVIDGDRGAGAHSSTSWANGFVRVCGGPGERDDDDDDHDDDRCDEDRDDGHDDSHDNDHRGGDCKHTHLVRDVPNWVSVTFDGLRTIQRVELYMPEHRPLRDYDVQVLASADWTTVAAVRDNTSAVAVHPLPAGVTTTSVRVVGYRGARGKPTVLKLSELEVYGY